MPRVNLNPRTGASTRAGDFLFGPLRPRLRLVSYPFRCLWRAARPPNSSLPIRAETLRRSNPAITDTLPLEEFLEQVSLVVQRGITGAAWATPVARAALPNLKRSAVPTRAKSANELWLNGSNRSRAKVKDASPVPAGRPKFSADLSRAARIVFKRLCKLLEERRSLTAGDSELLRIYSFLFDRHRRAMEKVLSEGEIVSYTRLDSNGQPHDVEKENLNLKVAERCEVRMVSILDRLGLTPVSKQKVQPTADGPQKRVPIPGSVWAENPEMFTDDGVYIPPEQRGEKAN
jgi:P27 family predicted phage terminase small subunit